jgi:hypothetical protein
MVGAGLRVFQYQERSAAGNDVSIADQDLGDDPAFEMLTKVNYSGSGPALLRRDGLRPPVGA